MSAVRVLGLRGAARQAHSWAQPWWPLVEEAEATAPGHRGQWSGTPGSFQQHLSFFSSWRETHPKPVPHSCNKGTDHFKMRGFTLRGLLAPPWMRAALISTTLHSVAAPHITAGFRIIGAAIFKTLELEIVLQ